MDFKTVENISLDVRKKGQWKPIFTSRFKETYFDLATRYQYEIELGDRIFSTSDAIVIVKNEYPLNFGNDVDQHVIWINKSKINVDSVSIDDIAKLFENQFPGKDYIIYIN